MNTSDDAKIARGRTMLKEAKWAARAFQAYDFPAVQRIVRAVSEAAYAHARPLAEQAARETGFGNVEDKVLKNEATSRSFVTAYADVDLVSPRVDRASKMLLNPRPAGVIFALTPSTSPVAAIYFKTLSALISRSAIVFSPHPAAKQTGLDVGRILADAATAAGAPKGAIQVLDDPTIPVVNTLMQDDLVNLILATGGLGVVRAAYSSGNPAIGVGPGNPPVIVDESADIKQAAADIVRSKSFDNSVLCTAESVLFAPDTIAKPLLDTMTRSGAHMCSAGEVAAVRDTVYPDGVFDPAVVGLTAVDLAQRAGIRVAANTKVLLTPIDHVFNEEPLTHEKLCPVLAVRRVRNLAGAIREAQSLLRIVGVGHSAVVHAQDPQAIQRVMISLPVHRITVNGPGSQGSAGIGTTLPISMSVGTGFIGGSSSGDNLTPQHLVQWNRAAFSDDPSVVLPDFPDFALVAAPSPTGPVPPQPRPSNAHDALGGLTGQTSAAQGGDVSSEQLRAELRRIVLEELRDLMGAR